MTITYLTHAALLLLGAIAVFRGFVRRDYRLHQRLTPVSSALQLAVWGGFFALPYPYCGADWARFWVLEPRAGQLAQLLSLAAIAAGGLIAFGTMLWFGLRRAIGLEVRGLIQSGPYRWSRNPQILGGWLLVIGSALGCPVGQSVGWVLLYGAISHMMIVTEEEHLAAVFADEYADYVANVPRYLGAIG